MHESKAVEKAPHGSSSEDILSIMDGLILASGSFREAPTTLKLKGAVQSLLVTTF